MPNAVIRFVRIVVAIIVAVVVIRWIHAWIWWFIILAGILCAVAKYLRVKYPNSPFWKWFPI